MVKVRVPATTANMGTGIDTLGLAVQKYLTVSLQEADTASVRFLHDPSAQISAEDNFVYQAAKRIYEKAKKNLPPLSMEMDVGIPFSRGLGSSAAAIVAGMWGANALLGSPFTQEELIYEAGKMEGHYDNILPAVLGGFTIAMPGGTQVHYQREEIGDDLKLIVAIPDYRLSTSKARAVLPKVVDLKTVLQQVGRAAYLAAALVNKDYKNLSLAMDDLIFTPARKELIPGFDFVCENARREGALTAVISGAGPTIIAYALENAENIAQAMEDGFAKAKISAVAHVIKADNTGVLLWEE